MRRFVGLVAIVLASGCSGGKDAPTSPGDTGTPTADVFTPGLSFSPAFLTVAVGTVVRFNITGTAHDVTFQPVAGAPASIPVTAPGTVISRTFNAKGTFPYDCRTHPGMSGTITVQ